MGEYQQVDLTAGTVRYRETGQGETIVFAHPLLANGVHWRKIVPYFESLYRCVLPDLPLGVHEPPMKPDADLSLQGLANLLEEFLAALGLEQVTLIGNDTGGAICQMMAARYPDRIARLVLTNSDSFDNFIPVYIKHVQYGAFIPGYIWLVAQLLRFTWIRRLPIAFGLITKHPLDPDVSNLYAGKIRTSPGVRRDFRRLLQQISTRYTKAADRAFPNFHRPVLIAWAEEDRLFPARYGKRMAERFPDAEYQNVKNACAFIPEDEPKQLSRMILDWLQRHPLPN